MIENLWHEHAKWSEKTFGTDLERGPGGALKHLKLEVDECLESPGDVEEYADCLLLIMDATRRAGFSLEELVRAATMKLEANKLRTYPRTQGDEPSFHIKGADGKS